MNQLLGDEIDFRSIQWFSAKPCVNPDIRRQFLTAMSDLFQRDQRTAIKLLARMADAIDDGADQHDLLRLAAAAVAGLESLQ